MGVTSCATLPFLPGTHVFSTVFKLLQANSTLFKHLWLVTLINTDSIGKMKDGVMIINTGRGKLINTEMLIDGLKSKKVGAAGLDVYEEEGEYFYEDKSDRIIDDDTLARLLSFNNVILTSHQGFFTKEALHNIAEVTLHNIRDFLESKPLINRVSLQSR